MFAFNTLKQISRVLKFSTVSRISTVFRIICINKQQRSLSKTVNLKNKKEYTESEEWLYHSVESTKIGLTNKAIDELTDLVYAKLRYYTTKDNEDIRN